MEAELRGETTRLGGLDATAVKLIAALIMTIDHIGAFCPDVPGVAGIMLPLRLVGRIAAPLFLYCVAESLRYTRDKRRFLRRMYLASVAVGIANETAAALIGGVSFGNIFQSFAWMIFFVVSAEDTARHMKAGEKREAASSAAIFLLILAASVLIDRLLEMEFAGVLTLRAVLHPFIRSPLEVEYSLGLIVLGVAWYYIPKKLWRCVLLAALCLLCALHLWGYTRALTMFSGIQWGMAGALPLLLLYNGRRGRGFKWFFYIYYPLNMYVLALINSLYK